MSVPINRREFDGDKFKDLRKNILGWSQEQMAQNLGISVKTVHRWEHNQAKPSPVIYRMMHEDVFGQVSDVENVSKK